MMCVVASRQLVSTRYNQYQRQSTLVKVVSSRYYPDMDRLPLSELLARIANLVSSELRTLASAHELKPVQLQALLYLGKCNRYSDTPAALTEYLGLTKGTVSQTVIALAGKDLLEKSPDPDDGRLVRLSLTPMGRAIVRKSQPLPFDDIDDETLREHLLELLGTAQRKRGGRSFGVCSTCSYFETATRGFRCGLTGEPLTQTATQKICREHLAA